MKLLYTEYIKNKNNYFCSEEEFKSLAGVTGDILRDRGIDNKIYGFDLMSDLLEKKNNKDKNILSDCIVNINGLDQKDIAYLYKEAGKTILDLIRYCPKGAVTPKQYEIKYKAMSSLLEYCKNDNRFIPAFNCNIVADEITLASGIIGQLFISPYMSKNKYFKVSSKISDNTSDNFIISGKDLFNLSDTIEDCYDKIETKFIHKCVKAYSITESNKLSHTRNIYLDSSTNSKLLLTATDEEDTIIFGMKFKKQTLFRYLMLSKMFELKGGKL